MAVHTTHNNLVVVCLIFKGSSPNLQGSPNTNPSHQSGDKLQSGANPQNYSQNTGGGQTLGATTAYDPQVAKVSRCCH